MWRKIFAIHEKYWLEPNASAQLADDWDFWLNHHRKSENSKQKQPSENGRHKTERSSAEFRASPTQNQIHVIHFYSYRYLIAVQNIFRTYHRSHRSPHQKPVKLIKIIKLRCKKDVASSISANVVWRMCAVSSMSVFCMLMSCDIISCEIHLDFVQNRMARRNGLCVVECSFTRWQNQMCHKHKCFKCEALTILLFNSIYKRIARRSRR